MDRYSASRLQTMNSKCKLTSRTCQAETRRDTYPLTLGRIVLSRLIINT